MSERLLIGIAGAIVGVIGWLFVGMYLSRRERTRKARNAGRAVFFELGANVLAVFTAIEYGMFGPLSRASYDQLLPELATWLPAAELQALALAYLGQGGYKQMAEEPDLPTEAREAALGGVLDAHRVALGLVRDRVFTAQEVASLDTYVTHQQARMIEVAWQPPLAEEVDHD